MNWHELLAERGGSPSQLTTALPRGAASRARAAATRRTRPSTAISSSMPMTWKASSSRSPGLDLVRRCAPGSAVGAQVADARRGAAWRLSPSTLDGDARPNGRRARGRRCGVGCAASRPARCSVEQRQAVVAVRLDAARERSTARPRGVVAASCDGIADLERHQAPLGDRWARQRPAGPLSSWSSSATGAATRAPS